MTRLRLIRDRSGPESVLTLPKSDRPRTLVLMKDHISKNEIRKDAIQDGVEAVTHAVGQGTNIVIGAVTDIAKTVGGLASDLFEIREASRRAAADRVVTAATDVDELFPPDPNA